MDFVGIVVRTKRVEVGVGDSQIGDLFAREVGRESALPVLMFAFDYTFGLGCGGVALADVVELELQPNCVRAAESWVKKRLW